MCPRCGRSVHPPGLFRSSWRCDWHGDVAPYLVPGHVGPELVETVRSRSGVPVWLPAPLPALWAVEGLAYAGDERAPLRAVVTAVSGPSPLGGPVDLLLVAEEMGVGLGAALAGVTGLDPGPAVGTGEPSARVEAGGHDTPLWEVAAEGCCLALAGEAQGIWLWVLAWATRADLLLLDDLRLADVREVEGYHMPLAELAYGTVTSRLVPAGSRSDNTG